MTDWINLHENDSQNQREILHNYFKKYGSTLTTVDHCPLCGETI